VGTTIAGLKASLLLVLQAPSPNVPEFIPHPSSTNAPPKFEKIPVPPSVEPLLCNCILDKIFLTASPAVPLPKVPFFMAVNTLMAVSGDFNILASIVIFPALPDVPKGIQKMGRNPAVRPAGQVR